MRRFLLFVSCLSAVEVSNSQNSLEDSYPDNSTDTQQQYYYHPQTYNLNSGYEKGISYNTGDQLVGFDQTALNYLGNSYQSGYMAGLSLAFRSGSSNFGISLEQYLQYQMSFSYANGIMAKEVPWIGFTKQIVNNNALFYPAYGLFQARIPGIYLFSFNAVSDDTDPFRIGLVRGYPRGMALVHAIGDDRGFHAVSQTAIVYLHRGDFVYLSVERGRIYESANSSRHFTSFTGTLLNPDIRQLTLLGSYKLDGYSGDNGLPPLPEQISSAVMATEGFEIRDV